MILFFSTALLLSGDTPAADDAYATAALGLGGVLAYWRLGDTGPGVLADASGNGHTGAYLGSPSFGGGDLTQIWQPSNGRSVDFAGNGYGTVAHHAVFALPQGSLSFWFEVNDLTTSQGLLGKDQSGTTAPDDQFAVLVGADGALLAYFQNGGAQVDLETIPGAVNPGVRHHCVVTWSEKIVRLWLDGRQVAKSEGHTTGLVANDLPWRFGIRTFDDTNADVQLDEIVLFDKALLFDEVQTLSQLVAGMGYRNSDALDTINVSDSSGLSSALSAAAPGDHIVLANGTYSGDYTLSANGTRANPIVVRSANGADNGTIAGEFVLSGDWLILDGVTCGDAVKLNGSHCRATRCKIENHASFAAAEVGAGSHFNRVDHCLLGPPTRDSGDATATNQCLRVLSNGAGENDAAFYTLSDHLHMLGSATELGNGRDVYSVGNFDSDTYSTLHRSLLDQSPHDELISGKASSLIIQHCTFGEAVYVQARRGDEYEWRSNYHDGCELNNFGLDTMVIGCVFDGHDLRLPPGGGDRPPSVSAWIIGNTFQNGAKVDAGEPDWETAIPASGVEAEANVGWNVTFSPHYRGTITNAGSTSERFEVAVKLTGSDVGPAASDPLVPPGWK